MLVRRVLVSLGAGAALLTFSACGAIAEQAIETAVEQAADGEDVNFDIDLDEGTAQIEVDGATGSIGAKVDRPDWLDDEYVLPDDIDLHAAVHEPDAGQMSVWGVVPDTSAEVVNDQQQAMLTNAGFEVSTDSAVPNGFMATHSDGREALVQFTEITELEGVQYSLTIHADTHG